MILKSLFLIYFFLFLLFTSCSHHSSQKQKKEKKHSSSAAAAVEKELPAPRFKDYPVDYSSAGNQETASVNFYSHPEAYKFRNLLREGMKAGVNFAGTMTIITHGCGENCQYHWVLDAKTGNILARETSQLGIAYRPDSTLIVLNPPTEALKNSFEKSVDKNPNPFWKGMKSTYLYWDGQAFQKLREKDLYNALLNHDYVDE